MTRSLTAYAGLLASSAVLCGACATSSTGRVSSVSSGSAAEWRSLFDGRSLAAWRGYKRADVPAGWQVVDGALTRAGRGGDIVTTDEFGDFELALEWKVAPGGNSGIMYRVTEEAEAPYETGPEMQVLDDARHPDGRSPLTSAGALYGLYPAPRGAVKAAGEWNAARVVVRGNHVEHWLNGVKTAEAEIGSDDWNRRVADSKFRQWPGFAKASRGHIALQDHGDWVAYRNIRIRELR
jgi:Domain of Unknown Function (DUF1080)